MPETKQLRYFRLRQKHPDLTPADAMDLADQQLADEAEQAAAPKTSPLLAAIQSAQKAPAAEPVMPTGEPKSGLLPDELHQVGEPAQPPMIQADTAPDEVAQLDAAEKKARGAANQRDFEGERGASINQGMRRLVGAITRTDPVEQEKYKATVPDVGLEYDKKRSALKDSLMRKRQAGMDTSTLALQQSEAEKNRAEAMKALREPSAKPVDPNAQGLRDAQTEHIKAETDALNRKPQEYADKTARLNAIIAEKNRAAAAAAGVATESNKIPAFGGMFVPRAGTKPEKELSKQAATHAGLYNAAVMGMDDLEGAVRAYVTNPSPDTKRDIDAKVSGVAAAVTAAHGGGAMADSEFDRQKNALGADPTSVAAMQALVSEALGSADGSRSLISKLHSSRSSLVEMAKGRLASSNYEFQPGKNGAPTAPAGAKKPRLMKDPKTGEMFEVE